MQTLRANFMYGLFNIDSVCVYTIKEIVKVSFHSNHKERKYQKCSNYHTTALISHASKVMLKSVGLGGQRIA